MMYTNMLYNQHVVLQHEIDNMFYSPEQEGILLVLVWFRNTPN